MIDINDFDQCRDERSQSIFEEAYLLNHLWGVGDEDAVKASESCYNAIENLISASVPGDEHGVSAASMEEWYFRAYRDEPHRAIEAILKTEWLANERYHKDVPGFYLRLSRALNNKGSSPADIALPGNQWKLLMITAWTRSTSKGHPPRCLWSDSALLQLSFGGAASEGAVRKEISRLKLYRPKSPCFGYESGPKGYFKFVSRSRGAVTKKK